MWGPVCRRETGVGRVREAHSDGNSTVVDAKRKLTDSPNVSTEGLCAEHGEWCPSESVMAG